MHIFYCEHSTCGWASFREPNHLPEEIAVCPVCGSQVIGIDWNELFVPFTVDNIGYVSIYGES